MPRAPGVSEPVAAVRGFVDDPEDREGAEEDEGALQKVDHFRLFQLSGMYDFGSSMWPRSPIFSSVRMGIFRSFDAW